MKVTLRLQFITAYLLLVICIFVLINTYGYSLTYNYLETKKEQQIPSEAYYLTSHYASTQGTPEDGAFTLQKQSTMLSSLFDTRVWLVSPTGTILSDSSDYDYVGKNITDSDSDFLNRQSVKGARPKGIMKSNVLAVICPLTGSKETKGYLVLLTPQKAIKEEATLILDTILICYLLLLLVSAIVFLLLYWRSVYPLKQLAHNAKEYADGHFDQKPAKLGGAEQLELASAVKYLAQKNKSMIEYQRQFLANVSHDFRSPLTSIRGYTEALADGTIPPEMQEKYLNIVLRETERLTGLTSGLLTLNSMDGKQNRLTRSNFDINAVIKNTAASFEGTCTAKHITIDLLFSDWHSYVNADMGKIQQVLYNLIDNAIKFSHPDSTITIETTSKYEKVFVSVRDTGIGIPKDSLKKIWERFYKTDLSRGKDKKGTGLGLSIVKEIIQLHGENINVVSTEGVGTEFIFSLSKVEEQANAHQ